MAYSSRVDSLIRSMRALDSEHRILLYRAFSLEATRGDRPQGGRRPGFRSSSMPSTLRHGHRGTSRNRAPLLAARRARFNRKKPCKIRTFRIARRGSLNARVLHSRLQKLGNVENTIWRMMFSHYVSMHTRVQCIARCASQST